MDSKYTLPISEARKRIFDIAEDIQVPGMYYTLTEKGKPKAVVLSAQEFESWQETFEVMNDFPSLKKDIAAARRDLKNGRTMPLQDFLKKQMKRSLNKNTSSHAVQRRLIKKSSKRSCSH